jgi:hypothetical protein
MLARTLTIGTLAIGTKSPAQRAYERDLAKYPVYHDGAPRPAWEDLSDVARGFLEQDLT